MTTQPNSGRVRRILSSVKNGPRNGFNAVRRNKRKAALIGLGVVAAAGIGVGTYFANQSYQASKNQPVVEQPTDSVRTLDTLVEESTPTPEPTVAPVTPEPTKEAYGAQSSATPEPTKEAYGAQSSATPEVTKGQDAAPLAVDSVVCGPEEFAGYARVDTNKNEVTFYSSIGDVTEKFDPIGEWDTAKLLNAVGTSGDELCDTGEEGIQYVSLKTFAQKLLPETQQYGTQHGPMTEVFGAPSSMSEGVADGIGDIVLSHYE